METAFVEQRINKKRLWKWSAIKPYAKFHHHGHIKKSMNIMAIIKSYALCYIPAKRLGKSNVAGRKIPELNGGLKIGGKISYPASHVWFPEGISQSLSHEYLSHSSQTPIPINPNWYPPSSRLFYRQIITLFDHKNPRRYSQCSL